MSSSIRGNLNKDDFDNIRINYEYMSNEIDASDIIDFLFSRKVFDLHVKETIDTMATKKDRTKHLLNQLFHAGPGDAYNYFVESLNEKYPHVALKLTSTHKKYLSRSQSESNMGETRSKDDGIADIRRLQRDLDAERTNRQEAQQQLEQVKAELSMILRKNKELQLQLVNCKQDLEKEKQNTQTAVEVKDKTTKHSSQMKGTLDDKSAEIKHLKDKIKSMETENSSTLSQLDLLLENLVQEFSNSMSEEKKKSIFLTASTCGLPGTVGHLAGIGVDINVQTKPSQPASLYDTGFFDESDAAISLHDDSNIPVLFYCAQKGDYKCVEKLIEKGADVRYKDSLGDTALMYASRGVCVPVAYSPKAKTKVEDRLITEDHVRCMEVLIQHGADVNARNFIGCSPLTYCTMYGSKSGVEKLLDKGARVDDKNNEGKAALHFAAVSYTDKQHDCVSAILRHGADVNITDSEGNTALILSVMNKNLQCIQKLLEYKPDLDVQNKIGVSALGLSAEHNKDDIVSLLLKAGAKHNIKFNKGETALIIAAKHNSVKVLKLLLGSGAVVNEVDDEGNTALIAAADNFNDESISCLLEAGANVNHRNKSGHTALSLLQSSSDTSSRKKCIKAFSNAGTYIFNIKISSLSSKLMFKLTS